MAESVASLVERLTLFADMLQAGKRQGDLCSNDIGQSEINDVREAVKEIRRVTAEVKVIESLDDVATEGTRGDSGRETGWVIERGDMPAYWDGRGRDTFVRDHLLAIRFAREEDAFRVKSWLLADDCRVTEHVWLDNPSSPSSAPAATPASQPLVDHAPPFTIDEVQRELESLPQNDAKRLMLNHLLFLLERFDHPASPVEPVPDEWCRKFGCARA